MSSILTNNSNTNSSDSATSANTSLVARKSMNNSNSTKSTADENGGSGDELTLLKEFFEDLKQQKYQNVDINNENAPQNPMSSGSGADLKSRFENGLRVTLECCVTREAANGSGPGSGSKSTTSQKASLSIGILEHLAKNVDSLAILDRDSTRKHIASLMTKTFFDKLNKLYETDTDLVLRLIKVFIIVLKKIIHHNLAVTNPLLQLIELSLKHSRLDIRAKSYDCWKHLIDNFALDRDFFFKPKKFSLILMPLASKSRAYKDEASCRSRAVSWLSLIEHINERLGSYLENVVVPFLSYSFGFNSAPAIDESGHNLLGAYKQEHDFQSLTQIGFETLLSIACNGNMTRLPVDCRKRIKYVNTNRDYQITDGFGDLKSWLTMLRFYFQVVLAKPAQFLDGMGALMIWQKLSFLFDCKYEMDTVDGQSLYKIACTFQAAMIDFLADYTIPSCKASDSEAAKNVNKNMTLLLRNVVANLKENFSKYEEAVSIEKLAKFLQKAATTLLAMDDEDGRGEYMEAFSNLISLLEMSQIHSVNLWTTLAMKYHDHLKHSKAKTIKLTTESFKAICTCLTFPFKNFRSLNIQENDTKLIVGTCSNVNKQIALAIKQSKFEVVNQDDKMASDDKHLKSVNSWCSLIFSQLADKFELNTAVVNPSAKLFDSSANLASMASASAESSVKYLQILSQYMLYIIQNIYEYDQINQFQANQDSAAVTAAGSDCGIKTGSPMISSANKSKTNIIEKLSAKSNSFQAMFAIFASLIELIQKQIKTFHALIQSSMNQPQSHHADYCKSPAISTNSSSSTTGTPTTDRNDKQATQVFINLIESLSSLFTRIKSHQVLSELLLNFAKPIELMSELNSISKCAPPDSAANSSSTPGQHHTPSSAAKKHSVSAQHRNSSSHFHSMLLQSTRRSSDSFDTFSMQIASHIQNHLSSIYYQHQFDSDLLETLEPIFYSFLKYSVKASLKQKTLQAWNSTFGKSTVSSLKYSPRLEALFVELREEMLTAKSHGSGGSHTHIAISLPGFKQHVEQSMTATMNTNDADFATKSDETIEASNMTCASSADDEGGAKKTPLSRGSSNIKDSLTNDSSMSMSVPVAHLMVVSHPVVAQAQAQGPTTPTSVKTAAAASKPAVHPSVAENAKPTSVFSFSPLDQATGSAHTVSVSHSASKLFQMRTPETNGHHANLPSAKTSPRHLKNHSKRKLDLNVLIDQMPDKDFVEIKSSPKKSSRTPRSPGTSLKAANSSSQQKQFSDRKSDDPQFKQPLTEHQKEMRKKRSFIPLEIQNVCSEIETTMDSQMSVTQDGDESTSNTLLSEMKSSQAAANKSPTNSSGVTGFKPSDFFPSQSTSGQQRLSFIKSAAAKKAPSDQETEQQPSESQIEMSQSFSADSSSDSKEVTIQPAAHSRKSLPSFAADSTKAIKFHSKINPKKQIELVELAESDQQSKSSFKNVTVVNITSAVPTVPAPKRADTPPQESSQTSSAEQACEDGNVTSDDSPVKSQSAATQAAVKVEQLEQNSSDPYEFDDVVDAACSQSQKTMDESVSELLTKKPPKSPSVRRSTRLNRTDDEIMVEMQDDAREESAADQACSSSSQAAATTAEATTWSPAKEAASAESLEYEEASESMPTEAKIKLKSKISAKAKLIKRLNEKRRLLLGNMVATATGEQGEKRKRGRPRKVSKDDRERSGDYLTAERVSRVQKLHDVDKDGPRNLTRINKKTNFFGKNKTKGRKNGAVTAANQELINRYKLRKLIRTKVIKTSGDDNLSQMRESPERQAGQAPEIVTPRTRRSISMAAQSAEKAQQSAAAEQKQQTTPKPDQTPVVNETSKPQDSSDDEDVPLSSLRGLQASSRSSTTPAVEEVEVVDAVVAPEAEQPAAKEPEEEAAKKETPEVEPAETSTTKDKLDDSDVVLMDISTSNTPKEAAPAKSVISNALQQQLAMMNSSPTPKMTNDAILQKLNGTPTSILKKRLTSCAHAMSSAHKNLNEELASASTTVPVTVASAPGVLNCLAQDTPSKRRVSFNEAVRVEEVEPYLCKSLTGRIATPRMQNRVKVVVSPNFNKPGGSMNGSSQMSSASSNANNSNSILNSLNGPSPSQQLNSSASSSSASAVSSTTPASQAATSSAAVSDEKQLVSPTANILPAGLNSPSLQASFVASKLASVVGSGGSQQQALSTLSQFKANMSRLSSAEPSSLLSPSNQNVAVPTASASASNTPTIAAQNSITNNLNGSLSCGANNGNNANSSPSSSSIFDMISSNRFLGSRYSMIQQQMQSNKNNRHSVGAIPISSPSLVAALNTPPEPVHVSPAMATPTASVTPAEKQQPAATPGDDMVHAKLKDCKYLIETVIFDLGSMKLLNGSNEAMLKILKSKNIVTVGQLCSLSSLEALSLPFKVPILENLRNFFQKHEEKLLKEKSAESVDEISEATSEISSISSTSSASATESSIRLGSVEEEMAKLEAYSSALDTSIESESFSEALNTPMNPSSEAATGLNAIEEENSSQMLEAGKTSKPTNDDLNASNTTLNAMDVDASSLTTVSNDDSLLTKDVESSAKSTSKSPSRLKGPRTRTSVDRSPVTAEAAGPKTKENLSRVRELFENQICKEGFKPEEVLASLARPDGTYNLSWDDVRELMEMADDMNSIVNSNSILWRKFLYSQRGNTRNVKK